MVAEILQTMGQEPTVKGSEDKPRVENPQPEDTGYKAGDFVEDIL